MPSAHAYLPVIAVPLKQQLQSFGGAHGALERWTGALGRYLSRWIEFTFAVVHL